MGNESNVQSGDSKALDERLNAIISSKSPYISLALIPLALAGFIGCYNIATKNKPIKHPVIDLNSPVVLPYSIEPVISREPVKKEPEKIEYPFILNTDNPAKKEVFDIIQRIVLEEGRDTRNIPLYMGATEAETKFMADIDKSDGQQKSLCQLISPRGAVGHMQVMAAAVPSGEKTLSKEDLRKLGLRGSYAKILREYCRNTPRKLLLEADVRFDPEKNIRYGIRVLSHCLGRFRPGTHNLYTFRSKSGSIVGNKYGGSVPEKALQTRTVHITDQREGEKYAAACYNKGDSGLIVSLVNGGSGSTDYSSHVSSNSYSFRRGMMPNPKYVAPRRMDTSTRVKKWQYNNKRMPRS